MNQTSPKTSTLLFALCWVALACDDDSQTSMQRAGADAEDAATTDAGWANTPVYMTAMPFAEPQEIRSKDGVLAVELESKEVDIDFGGVSVRGTVYNGAFVGPTLRLAPGESLHLALKNTLQQHTNVHYHGMHVSPEGNSDNIFLMIEPGSTYDYVVDVPADHDVGTFWYHSHMHMDAESQVFGGLSGVLIVDGLENRLPKVYRAIEQHLFALKDAQVVDGKIIADNINSDAPTVRTVNGLVQPQLTVRPNETQLWRLANIGADIFYDVAFAGQPFVVIAEDANPVEQPWTAYDLVLPPGKRFDVVVTAPAAEGEYAFETLSYNQGGDHYPDVPLVSVHVKGESVPDLPPLTEGLDKRDGLDQAEIAMRRTWTFTEDDASSMYFINGKIVDLDRVDAQPKLGTVEEWTVKNDTSEQHPFHIHINDFKVMAVNGVPYVATGEQDTVVLPPGGEVTLRLAFLDFIGKFVFHCHILAHEDGGMMAVVEVVP